LNPEVARHFGPSCGRSRKLPSCTMMDFLDIIHRYNLYIKVQSPKRRFKRKLG
jgi:hypothetical protein